MASGDCWVEVFKVGVDTYGTSEKIYICPNCVKPSYFSPERGQIPGEKIGEDIKKLPRRIAEVLDETRDCYASNCYTAVVLMCRTLLMHIAVQEKAPKKDPSFAQYIQYIVDKWLVPERCKVRLDQIRSLGGDAAHQITEKTEEDARTSIEFLQIVLKMAYEYADEVVGDAEVENQTDTSE